MLEMEESGSHQPTIRPHQDNVNPHQAESGGSQRNNSIVNTRSCIAHGEDAHHLIQSLPLRRQMMPRTGEGPEIRPVKLSLATKNIAISVRIRAQLIRALGTMP